MIEHCLDISSLAASKCLYAFFGRIDADSETVVRLDTHLDLAYQSDNIVGVELAEFYDIFLHQVKYDNSFVNVLRFAFDNDFIVSCRNDNAAAGADNPQMLISRAEKLQPMLVRL